MEAAHQIDVRDAFYALVLDEIRHQPNLEKELGSNELGDVVIRGFGWVLEQIGPEIEKGWSGLSDSLIVGPGIGIIKHLAPPPASFLRDAADILSMIFGSNYDALCRSALLHLFWGEIDKAKRKVELAKQKHDDRAFGHHVYGLLQGLRAEVDGARFELHLAHEREGFEGARQRIYRALQLVM